MTELLYFMGCEELAMIESANRRPPESATPMTLLLARVTWFFLGPMALAGAAAFIVSSRSGWFTGYDAFFLLVMAAMIAARWFELRSGLGTDAYGDPATTAAFWPFLRAFVPLAAVVWIVANVLGNHVLGQ